MPASSRDFASSTRRTSADEYRSSSGVRIRRSVSRSRNEASTPARSAASLRPYDVIAREYFAPAPGAPPSDSASIGKWHQPRVLRSDQLVAGARGRFESLAVEDRDRSSTERDTSRLLERSLRDRDRRALDAQHHSEELLGQSERVGIDSVMGLQQPARAPLVEVMHRVACRRDRYLGEERFDVAVHDVLQPPFLHPFGEGRERDGDDLAVDLADQVL